MDTVLGAYVMKELPATLILRPFNFDTLAIRAHQLASDEQAGPRLAGLRLAGLPQTGRLASD